MKVRFFDPGAQYRMYREQLDDAYHRVADRGDLILREDVEVFENKLAEFVGTKYAVGVNSCTDALYLALKWAGIGPGDEVLVPSRTFVATPQVIVQLGATPVFYDLDGSFNITEKTRAIMPVHIEGAFEFGFKETVKLAKEHDLLVVEDAAQALGAVQDGRKAGSIGDAGAFSFYPAKILGCLGDAGALTTDNQDMYQWVRGARNHFGREDGFKEWGVNSRMDNLQAAFLNVKIEYLPRMLDRRNEVAMAYDQGLKTNSELMLPERVSGRVYQDYIIRTPRRDELFDYLKLRGVETMKNNYPFPTPKLPLAQKYEDETLRLPCNEMLTDEEVGYVIDMTNAFFAQE